MFALKVLGGLLLFIPGFVLAAVGGSKLSERHHTGLALLVIGAGLAVALASVLVYGAGVR